MRQLIPDPDLVLAIDHIRKNCMAPEQIAYRYTVDQIDRICAEIGLPPISGEVEADKVIRLHSAIFDYCCGPVTSIDSSRSREEAEKAERLQNVVDCLNRRDSEELNDGDDIPF